MKLIEIVEVNNGLVVNLFRSRYTAISIFARNVYDPNTMATTGLIGIQIALLWLHFAMEIAVWDKPTVI